MAPARIVFCTCRHGQVWSSTPCGVGGSGRVVGMGQSGTNGRAAWMDGAQCVSVASPSVLAGARCCADAVPTTTISTTASVPVSTLSTGSTTVDDGATTTPTVDIGVLTIIPENPDVATEASGSTSGKLLLNCAFNRLRDDYSQMMFLFMHFACVLMYPITKSNREREREKHTFAIYLNFLNSLLRISTAILKPIDHFMSSFLKTERLTDSFVYTCTLHRRCA